MFFADRLIQLTQEAGTRLCLGIDPDFERIPRFFRRDPYGLYSFCALALVVAEGRVPAVKFQSAFFEMHGSDGVRVLEDLIREARTRGFLVILDAKRGDVGASAQAYATAYLAEGSRLEVDALTVNPWCGLDAMEPFVWVAEKSMKGLFVVTRTTNEESGYLQGHGLEPTWTRLASRLDQMSDRLRGEATGLSGLGAVVGIMHSRAARAFMPDNLFLMPGYGEQGGTAQDAAPGGGLVSASRSLLFPRKVERRAEWMNAVSEALDEASGAV